LAEDEMDADQWVICLKSFLKGGWELLPRRYSGSFELAML